MKLLLLTVLMLCLNMWLVKAQMGVPRFDQDIEKAVTALKCKLPDQQFPVSVEARLIQDQQSDSLAVIIKVLIADGWHIYSSVPKNMPYIVTEYILEPDTKVKKAGNWKKTKAAESGTEKGVMLYENQAIFIHKLKKTTPSAKGELNVGLYYQCCNKLQCMVPTEQTFKLNY